MTRISASRDAPGPCPRTAEYDWLDGIRKRLEACKAELLAGYPRLGLPDDIDDAHSHGEEMTDKIWNRMLRLDAGEDD